jgi:hypothetical protein
MTGDVLNELGPRGPGRPRGSKNRNRVASVETINRMADPISWQCKALKRGWVRGQRGEKEYLSVDQKIGLAVSLGRKVLADLRSGDVTGIQVNGTSIQVITGVARLPGDPLPIDVTPTTAALPPPAEMSLSAAVPGTSEPDPDAVALPAGRPRHSSPAPVETGPSAPSSSERRLYPKSDDNLDRARADDAKIAVLNNRASRFIA